MEKNDGQIQLEKWTEFYRGAFEILYEEAEFFLNEIMKRNQQSGAHFSTATLIYRKALECLYGQVSLIKNNEFLLMKSFNRELLEAAILLAYCSEGNKIHRMLSYSVFNLLEEKNSLHIASEYSEQYKKFMAKVKRSKVPDMEFPTVKPEYRTARIKALDDELNSPPYAEIYLKYYKGAKTKIKKWYEIDGGSPSLEQLADKLGYGPIYELKYRNYSQYAHSTSLHKRDILLGVTPEGQGILTGVPAPPFFLAEEFNYCFTFTRISINGLLFIYTFFSQEEVFKIRNRIDSYFEDHKVKQGGNFFSKDLKQISHFPHTLS